MRLSTRELDQAVLKAIQAQLNSTNPNSQHLGIGNYIAYLHAKKANRT